MKTTLELPDELMIAVKVRAARESRKLKDVIAEALRQHLGMADVPRRTLREIKPVSVGAMLVGRDLSEDRLGDMLDERGDRY